MTPDDPPSRSSGGDKERCGIADCPEPAARSIARLELRRAFPDLEEGSGRVPVCRVHYKAYKKATKSDRSLERLGRYP